MWLLWPHPEKVITPVLRVVLFNKLKKDNKLEVREKPPGTFKSAAWEHFVIYAKS